MYVQLPSLLCIYMLDDLQSLSNSTQMLDAPHLPSSTLITDDHFAISLFSKFLPRSSPITHSFITPSLPRLLLRSWPPFLNHLSILPGSDPIGLGGNGIHPNAITDLAARDITVLQSLEIDKNLIRESMIGLGTSGTGQEASGAGQVDAEMAEVGTRGVCESDVDGSSGFEGGVGLSV